MNNFNKSKQRFSIRKYHFGAASVLLGMFFATTNASAQTENVTTNVESSLNVVKEQKPKLQATTTVTKPEEKKETTVVRPGEVKAPQVEVQPIQAPKTTEVKSEAPKLGEATVAYSAASSLSQEDLNRINALKISEEEKAELIALLESGEATLDELIGGAEETETPAPTAKTVIEEDYVSIKPSVKNNDVKYAPTHVEKLKSLEEATIYLEIKPGSDLAGRFGIYNVGSSETHDAFTIFSTVGIVRAELFKNGYKYDFTSTKEVLEAGKWNNIAFVQNNRENKLYVNGKLAYANISPTSGMFIKDLNVDTVTFGPSNGKGGQLFYGGKDFEIKNFKVFDKVLTDAELTDLSRYTTPTKEESTTDYIAKSSLYGTEAQTGYYGYRVPYTIKTKEGTLLTSASKHIKYHIDWGDLNIGLMRSEDNGKTWSKVEEIVDLAENPAGKGIASSAFTIDTAMVQDSKTGKIILLTDVFRESQGLFDRVKDHRPQYTGKYLNLYTDDQSTEAYTVRENGVVYDSQGKQTEYTVVTPDLSKDPKKSDIGNIIKDGKVVGNYFFTNQTPFRVVNRVYTWQLESTDNGKTWSNPKDITKDLLGQGVSDILISPTTGIQTESGRLIMPVYYTDPTYRAGRFTSGVLYSDDNGVTWNNSRVSDKFVGNSSENSIVDLGNNKLVMAARSDGGKAVLFYKSNDGGKTWDSTPQTFAEIPTYRVQPSLIKTSYNGKDYVILSSALGPKKVNGSLFLLEVKPDGGLEFVKSKVFEPGNFGYSSLTKLSDDKFMVTYENLEAGYNHFSIAKKYLDMEWLLKEEEELKLNNITAVNKLEGNLYEFVYEYPVTTVLNPAITVGGSQGTFVKQSDTNKLVFEINDIREISPQVTHTGIESVDAHKINDARVKLAQVSNLAALQQEEKPTIVIKSEKGASTQTEEKPSIVIETRKGESVQEAGKEEAKIPVAKGLSVSEEKPTIVIKSEKGASTQTEEKPSIVIETRKGESVQEEEKAAIKVKTAKVEALFAEEKRAIPLVTAKGTGIQLEGNPVIKAEIRKESLLLEPKPELVLPTSQEVKPSPEITSATVSNAQVETTTGVQVSSEQTSVKPRVETTVQVTTNTVTNKSENVVRTTTAKGVLPKTSSVDGSTSVALPAGLVAALTTAGLLAVRRRKEN